MHLLTSILLISLVVYGAAKFSFNACNTSEDKLYIIVDSTLDQDMTFIRIKNFITYFISKSNNISENIITFLEPFQQNVWRFSNLTSSDEVFVNLDRFKRSTVLSKFSENYTSPLQAFSFVKKTFEGVKRSMLSVIAAWFFPCFGSCHKTIRFFEEHIAELGDIQTFLYLSDSLIDSVSLSHNLFHKDSFSHIILSYDDNLLDNNLIAIYLCLECPSGWTKFTINNDPFDFTCYKVFIFPNDANCVTASTTCNREFSRLPRIETNETLEFLIGFMEDSLVDKIPNFTITFFIDSRIAKNIIFVNNLNWEDLKIFIPSQIKTGNCVIFKNIFLKGRETESLPEKRISILGLINCNEKITRIVLCEMYKDEIYGASKDTYYETKGFEKKRSIIIKEFDFIEDNRLEFLSKFNKTVNGSHDYDRLLFDCGDSPQKVVYSKVCNGRADCNKGRDEVFCDTASDCLSEYFYCTNPNAKGTYPITKKILLKQRCNLIFDCPDNSDEEGCEGCMDKICSDGTCVPNHWLPNNWQKCTLYSSTNGITFVNVTIRGEVIQTQQYEVVYCHLSDLLSLVTMHKNNSQKLTWAPKCIFLRGRSGVPLGCNDMRHLKNCEDFICPKQFMKCNQSYCIPHYLMVDGLDDCPDGEDEIGRLSLNKYKYYFCSDENLKFIPDFQVCDGFTQCPAGDDELNCKFECPIGFYCNGDAVILEDNSKVHAINSFRMFDIQTTFLNLSSLDLSLVTELYILPNLLELHASNCNLSSLDFLFGETFEWQVFYLDLSYNRFTQIDFNEYGINNFKNLQFLNLTRNTILLFLNGDFINFRKLKKLDLSATNMSVFNIASIQVSNSLRFFNVANTHLENLKSFLDKEELDFLDIRNTNLKENETIYVLKKMKITSGLYTDNIKYCCPQVVGMRSQKHVCHAPFDGISSCEDLIGDVMKRSLLLINAGIALIGNFVVFAFVIYFDREVLKEDYGIFVINMGIADFFMGVYGLIISFEDINYRDTYILVEEEWRASTLCTFSGFLSVLSSESSIFFILLITLKMFLTARSPFGECRTTLATTTLSVLAPWFIGFVIAAVPIVNSQWATYSSNGMCFDLPFTLEQHPGWEYSVGVYIILNCILFVAISCGQVLIFISTSNQPLPSETVTVNDARSEQGLVFARQLFITALSDFLCWFPVFVTGLNYLIGHEINHVTRSWIIVFIHPLKSTLNPLIYLIPRVYKKWRVFKNGLA